MPDCYDSFELNSAQRGTVATILDEGDGPISFRPMPDAHALIIDGKHEWLVRPNGVALHGRRPETRDA